MLKERIRKKKRRFCGNKYCEFSQQQKSKATQMPCAGADKINLEQSNGGNNNEDYNMFLNFEILKSFLVAKLSPMPSIPKRTKLHFGMIYQNDRVFVTDLFCRAINVYASLIFLVQKYLPDGTKFWSTIL